ncbi:MAG: hypothetical protein PUE80_03200 [bacterium]|nr:hypothetical protein [bacterium]
MICHDRPSEAHYSRYDYLQAALGYASLAWSCPRYAISDGGWGDYQKSAPRGIEEHLFIISE